MRTDNYYLGLDLGTNSIGWAVTDENYNILRIKGKDAWGVRTFGNDNTDDTASPAAGRRTIRTNRRRIQRERTRIGVLKLYFSDAIEMIDPYFYQRLDNSKLYPEDKDENVAGPNAIFDDTTYTDKDYYKEFPTIFHLRKALIEEENRVFDVRLVYLALLNMYKHRGHFLNRSISENGGTETIEEAYSRLRACVYDLMEIDLPDNCASLWTDTLSNRSLSRSEKAEIIAAGMGVEKKNKKDKRIYIINAVCGLSVNAVRLFDDIDSEEKITFSFSDYGFEEKADELAEKIGTDNYALIETMKDVYESGSLAAVLKGFNFLSQARVAGYEKHKEDLKILKTIYREISEEAYTSMFRSDKKGSYSAYVGSVNSDDYAADEVKHKLRRDMDGRKRDDLYKRIKEDLKHIDSEYARYVLDEISKETFLPKQLTAENGMIPNQVHKSEMQMILSNAERYLSFLLEKDASGLTVSERILQLFSFQIPYYIGPITEMSEKNGGNGWVVRKEAGQVFPWNFNEKIDDAATRERFIQRLIRECTYITGEKVLPKASLLYERFCVLNEINNIRIDNERISPELKQEIYKDLFERGKKVTHNQLCRYLINHGKMEDESQLTGVDKSINNSLTSFGRFYAIFGENIRKDSTKSMVEDIIRLSTIYGDAKKLLSKQIEQKYGDRISPKDIKRILGYKFSDWGNLSKAILELSGCDRETGEVLPLIQALWDTNLNFNELLFSDRFSYKEELEDKKSSSLKTLQEFKITNLDVYYFSAPVRRMVWQTIQIVDEVTKIIGHEPERIFIEMIRHDEEKGDRGRKDSRKTALLQLYKNIRDDRDWAKEIAIAGDNDKLKIKKLYLYYMQMGRCMYTGESISPDQLMDNNLYDIDHIYPRHFVKDDSIMNNLVLVRKDSNQYMKQDAYPIPEVSAEVNNLWRSLHEMGFINDEKYHRLTCRSPFSEDQLAGFIERQMVETGQGTKGVADILKQLLPNTTLVYSKGANVSDFRNEFKLPKVRSLNDLHHANDAYLNIVVGNVYYTKFTSNPRNFIRREYSANPIKNNYHLGKMFERDISRGGRIAWKAPKDGAPGSIATVKKMMERNTPIMTCHTFAEQGAFSNATVYSKRKANPSNYLPIKTADNRLKDVKKYGGVTSLKVSELLLVEHRKGKKRVLSFEPLYVYAAASLKTPDDIKKYCEEYLGLVDPIVRNIIKKHSLIKLNGYYYRISGIDGRGNIELHNAVSMFVPCEVMKYLHKIEKAVNGINDKEITKEDNIAIYDILTRRYSSKIFESKNKSVKSLLENGRIKFAEMSMQKQCEVLQKIMVVGSTGAGNVNLSDIGGSTEEGRIRITGNMTNCRELILINQSVSGLYESKEDLLK